MKVRIVLTVERDIDNGEAQVLWNFAANQMRAGTLALAKDERTVGRYSALSMPGIEATASLVDEGKP